MSHNLQRALTASVIVAAVATGGATASGPGAGATAARQDSTPRFLLSKIKATWDDQVRLRVERGTAAPAQRVRLYLAPAAVARSLRSRFDARLSFIGTVRTARQARLVFTLPPLEAGIYALVYWCRSCLSSPSGIGVQLTPTLKVTAPEGESCSTTEPSGSGPRGSQRGPGVRWHGNGELGALLRSDGRLITNSLGGYKLLWAAKEDLNGQMVVRYRMLSPPSEWITTLRAGRFREGEAVWPSQMSFTPGCWQIVGRLGDVSLSFVVSVELGSS